MGMPVATIAAPYAVAGCAFVPPVGNGPCVTAMWTVGAVRVLALAQPVVIMTGMATCVPTGTPLLPVMSQTRVLGKMPERLANLLPGLATNAQRAIQFTRSTPGIAAALVGMSKREHVMENLGVARVAPVTREEYVRLYQ